MDLDEIERLAQACVDATQKIDGAPNAYTRWDAEQEAHAPYEDLGLHGADVLALIARLRAAEARTAWQPMDTAPSGRMVLTSTRHEIVHVHGTRVWHRASLGMSDGHQWYDEHESPMHTPSAWMPLPEPPRD